MIPAGLSQRNILFPDPQPVTFSKSGSSEGIQDTTMPVSPKINKTVLIFISRVFWLRDQNKTSLRRFADFFYKQDETGVNRLKKVFDFGFPLFQINFNNVLE
jgi:hypothetical protein